MSVQNGNESYNRCIAELRARYGTRGVSANIRREQNEIRKAEEQNNATSNYYLYDSRSKIAASYKSGEYNGSKYMTSDDFVRYFRSRRPYVSPAVAVAKKGEQNVASRTPATSRESSDSKEGHLSRAVSTLKELVKEWLPTERKEGRTRERGFRFPAMAICYVLVFSFSLGLLVSGSVMIGNATGELGELNTKIAVLEARESELQSKLDLKYDIESIKADAEMLGMISCEFAGGNTLEALSDEEVEVYETESDKSGFAALLSAIGISIK